MKPAALRLGALVALLLTLLQTAPLAGQFADPMELVKNRDRAMAKAVLDGDREAFKAFLGPEVIFLAVSDSGPEAVTRAWSAYFEEKRLSLLQWEPDRGHVASSDDLAYTTGPYDFQRTGPDGKVAHVTGRYLTLWQSNGTQGWQVWADGSWLDPAEGTFAAQLAALWPAAGAPDATVELKRRPLKVATSKAGDLMLVVGELEIAAGSLKAKGRYATVSAADGHGGWKLIAEGAAPLVEAK